MNAIKKLIGAGLAAAAIGSALPGPAYSQSAYAEGPDWIAPRLESYRNYIARMSADDRSKLMAMEDKLMQMEMDQKMSMMKMDMDKAKLRRDMEMFILSHVGAEGH